MFVSEVASYAHSAAVVGMFSVPPHGSVQRVLSGYQQTTPLDRFPMLQLGAAFIVCCASALYDRQNVCMPLPRS